MIRHQAVPKEGQKMVVERLTQQVQVDSSLRVGREDGLATIAALRDMMCHIRDYDAS